MSLPPAQAAEQPTGSPQGQGGVPSGINPATGKPYTGAYAYLVSALALSILLIVGGPLINAIALLIGYHIAKGYGPLALENTRQAANWALTCLIGFTIGLLVTVAAFSPVPLPLVEHSRLPFIVSGMTILVVCAVANAVVVITGFIVAKRGSVFANRFAIPFIRPTK